MASSLSFPILIPFAMESPSCVTVPHMAFSKPPKHHRPLVRGRVRVRPLNRHLNSATLFRCSAAADDAVITLHVGVCSTSTSSLHFFFLNFLKWNQMQNFKSTSLSFQGMMCEGCANSVKKLLESRVSDSNSSTYVVPVQIFHVFQ